MEPKVKNDAKEKAQKHIEKDATIELKSKERNGNKWEGKARTKLIGISARQVWDLLEQDFCSFHKWLPTIDTCFHVDGIKGQPGLVRYCASKSSPSDDDDDEKWCHEKLVAIDHVEHCMSYEVLDNNMGLKSYAAKIKVFGLENGGGCEIEWCFLSDPVDGFTCEDFTAYLSFALNVQKKEGSKTEFKGKERNVHTWEGEARTKLNGISAQQVWDLLEQDFCSFHKWLPTIDTCFHVDGIKGQPGLVRYCASTSSLSDDDDDEKMKMVKWCHEKLLAIDHEEHCMSYEVLDNNLGLKSYVAKFKVSGLENGGCEIEWCFLSDPVDGLTCEDLTAYLSFTLQGMAQRMEIALL